MATCLTGEDPGKPLAYAPQLRALRADPVVLVGEPRMTAAAWQPEERS